MKLFTFILILSFVILGNKTFAQVRSHINYNETDSISAKQNIFLNHILFDTVSLKNLAAVIGDLNQIKIKSAMIFFSGNGFTRTVTMSFNGDGASDEGEVFRKYFDRCVAGSRITLEKFVIINKNGSLSPVYNKSIYIK